MKNKKLIWLIGPKLGKESITYRKLSQTYLIIHLQTVKTLKNYLLSQNCKLPGVYIFAQEEAMQFFCEDRAKSVPYLSTIIIGKDHPTAIKTFYSIGLLNYISPGSKYQLLAQIDLILNKQLDRPEMADINWSELTVKEKKILGILSENINCPVSREEIINSVWNSKIIMNKRSFDVHLCNLRKKIENSPYKILKAGDGKYQFEIGKNKKTRLIRSLKKNSEHLDVSMPLQ